MIPPDFELPTAPVEFGLSCPGCNRFTADWVVELLWDDDGGPTHAQVLCDECARIWWIHLPDRPIDN